MFLENKIARLATLTDHYQNKPDIVEDMSALMGITGYIAALPLYENKIFLFLQKWRVTKEFRVCWFLYTIDAARYLMLTGCFQYKPAIVEGISAFMRD